MADGGGHLRGVRTRVRAYIVITVFALLDAVLPVVPSETAVITAGVAAAAGDLTLPVVLGCAGARRLRWAQRQLSRRGGELIVVGRFIPGARTAVTVTAGTTRFPWPRFARYDLIAASLWATYAGLVGYLGGKAFEASPGRGLVLALALALTLTLGVEVTRWSLRQRRR